jgi:3-hydroxybutyryl-CoA dehydrogenase
MKVGVIGAGTMGQGIAKAFAQVEGFTVALCDIKQEWAEGGKNKIAAGYAKLVAKGKLDQAEVDRRMAAITAGLKEDLCADCDLIVEAAFEDMKVKQTTFGELDKICKPECIFASNTSSLSITEIGKGLTRPLVGMHFFNPADRMKLIEVIAGVNTPVETVEAIKKISTEIGKSPVQVNEAAGFVVNRILIPMINEAAFIKMEGVSDIAGIDTAMKLDGSPGTGRLHRSGHLPGHHGRSVQGDRRQQVPRLPADPQDGSRRQPGLQDRQGLLCLQCRPHQDCR